MPFDKNVKVILSKNATTYEGASKGKAIPSTYKGKTYTVTQSDATKTLLKELNSWVKTSECSLVKTKDYNKLGKQVETCLKDIENLSSVKSLIDLL